MRIMVLRFGERLGSQPRREREPFFLSTFAVNSYFNYIIEHFNPITVWDSEIFLKNGPSSRRGWLPNLPPKRNTILRILSIRINSSAGGGGAFVVNEVYYNLVKYLIFRVLKFLPLNKIVLS